MMTMIITTNIKDRDKKSTYLYDLVYPDNNCDHKIIINKLSENIKYTRITLLRCGLSLYIHLLNLYKVTPKGLARHIKFLRNKHGKLRFRNKLIRMTLSAIKRNYWRSATSDEWKVSGYGLKSMMSVKNAVDIDEFIWNKES